MKLFFYVFLFLAISCSAGLLMEKEPPVMNMILETLKDEGKIIGRYDDKIILKVEFDKNDDLVYEYMTNDALQSSPMVQIATLFSNEEKPHRITVTLYLSDEAGVMRSRRACNGEAILGRLGNPLIKDVAGVYDFRRDFLLEWNGANWSWIGDKMERDKNGNLFASFTAVVSNAYFNFAFRPRYYNEHLGYRDHEPWIRTPSKESINGWCSWNAYRSSNSIIDMDIVKTNAAFISKYFLPYGMEVMQIDNGFYGEQPNLNYGSLADSWMKPCKRFPQGPPSIAKTISSYGLRPGIWFSPNVWNYNIGKYKNIICRNKDGEEIRAGWMKHVLDMSDSTITNHYVPVFKAFKDAGFTYFKIDSLRHVLYEGLMVAYGREEARRRFRNWCLAARLTLGDDAYILASWGVLQEVAGTFDACRLFTDAWKPFLYHHYQIYYTAEFFPLNRVLFLNDPDYVVMSSNKEWVRSDLSRISLTGGLLMYSDKPEEMDDDRIFILQRVLPSLQTYPAESGQLHFNHQTNHIYGKKYNSDDISEADAMRQVGPMVEEGVADPFSTLFAIHIAKNYGSWCVMERNALWSLKESSISLGKLNLDTKKKYLAYDFWQKKFLGIIKGEIKMPALKFGHVQVVCLREKEARPQFLASDRHVSMDAVSVEDIVWNDNKLCLKLKLVVGSTTTYSFYVPDGYSLKKAFMEKGKAEIVLEEKGEDGQVVNVLVTAKEINDSLTLTF